MGRLAFRVSRCFALTLVLIGAASGKEPELPPQMIVWPSSGKPVVRFNLSFTLEKPKKTVIVDHQVYLIDVIAQNVWNKKISKAEFSLYFYDAGKVRVGEAWISLSDVSPGEIVKLRPMADISGIPVSVELVPQNLPEELQPEHPPKTVSITVNSIPQGAALKVDGADAGITPKIIQVTPGKHMLEFDKEGFNPGHFPLEITQTDTSGGSVSYELGVSTHDTVELRDGSVLVGDVESVSATEVLVRVGGVVQHLDRNQVKNIALVQRENAPQ